MFPFHDAVRAVYVHGEDVGEPALPQRIPHYVCVSSTTTPDRRHIDKVKTQRDVCGSSRSKSRACKDGETMEGRRLFPRHSFICYTTKQNRDDLSGRRNLMHLSRKCGHKNICFGLILSILTLTTTTYASTRNSTRLPPFGSTPQPCSILTVPRPFSRRDGMSVASTSGVVILREIACRPPSPSWPPSQRHAIPRLYAEGSER